MEGTETEKNHRKRKSAQERLQDRHKKLELAKAGLAIQKAAWLKQGDKLKDEEKKLQTEEDKIILETVHMLDLRELIFTKPLESLLNDQQLAQTISERMVANEQ